MICKVKTSRNYEPGDSVSFRCPGCGEVHVVPVKGEGAWSWNGSFDNPTLSPSLLVRSGHYAPGHEGPDCWCTYNANTDEPSPFSCSVCHSFVRDGKIEFLSDCTHALAGQTVELPDLPEPTLAWL